MTVQETFENIGADFLSSEQEISEKLRKVNCFIFDWDGVFNNGVKDNVKGSAFSEADSMGLNMLRFSYWLIHAKLPFVAIITGENNLSAQIFAEREHLNAVVLKASNKKEALEQLSLNHGISSKQSLFVFDDILDLALTEICSINLCIRRKASPLFNDFVIRNKICDYISASMGGNNAVREISELLIGLNANYDQLVSKRMKYDGEYAAYLSERNLVQVNKS